MAESGTHGQLLDQAGVYSELWSGMRNVLVFEDGLLIAYTAQETSPDGEEYTDLEEGVEKTEKI